MTYIGEDDFQEVVPELRLRIDGDSENGDYLKLRHGLDDCVPGEGLVEPSSPTKRCSVCYWVRFFLLLVCLVVLAGVFIKWVGPFCMDKVSIFVIELFFLSSLS